MFSIDAEQSVLGAILLDSDCLDSVLEILDSEIYFYEPLNALIYKTILKLFEDGEKIDFIKILFEICKEDKAHEKEIRCHLLELVNIVPHISNVEAYAKIVKEKYNKREICKISEYAVKELKNKDDVKFILNEVNKKFSELERISTEGKPLKGKELLSKVLDKVDKIKSCGGITGLKTGFKTLDKEITGLNKGELIIIAGRPGMGKTSFALNMATNIAKNHNVLFFSLEMSASNLMLKCINSELGFRLEDIDTKKEDNQKLLKCLEDIEKLNIFIDDSSEETVPKIKFKTKKLKNIEAIFVDHLGLLKTDGRNANKVQEISELTRDLKILAKTLDIPVICLSQLSRASESRQDKRPVLSDLRDSGSIEQDADVVLMLYRPGYYANLLGEKVDQNLCEIIIAKNRHGSPKTVEIKWDGSTTKFTEKQPECAYSG